MLCPCLCGGKKGRIREGKGSVSHKGKIASQGNEKGKINAAKMVDICLPCGYTKEKGSQLYTNKKGVNMKTVNLSDSEWKLMNLLWERSPYTITELVAQLKEDTGWSKHTIITMLSRLEAKGAVRHQQGEKAKQFYPDIDPQYTRCRETRGFLSRLYQGSLGLMVNTLVQENQLTKEEIDQLYLILKQAEEEQKW